MAGFLTKADLRRAVIRTAAKAHWRHDRTGTRAIAAAVQDNDGWTSAAARAAMIAFARQQIGAPFDTVLPNPPGARTPHSPAAPGVTLQRGFHPLSSAPVGTAAHAGARSCLPSAAVPAFCVQSLHNDGISHV